ncbi:hypothetical protein LIA77_11466 [Sarocladium implicatum]|nr:hypothetical protein LIA77_11466 [Sarocladium implicatum]
MPVEIRPLHCTSQAEISALAEAVALFHHDSGTGDRYRLKVPLGGLAEGAWTWPVDASGVTVCALSSDLARKPPRTDEVSETKDPFSPLIFGPNTGKQEKQRDAASHIGDKHAHTRARTLPPPFGKHVR